MDYTVHFRRGTWSEELSGWSAQEVAFPPLSPGLIWLAALNGCLRNDQERRPQCRRQIEALHTPAAAADNICTLLLEQ